MNNVVEFDDIYWLINHLSKVNQLYCPIIDSIVFAWLLSYLIVVLRYGVPMLRLNSSSCSFLFAIFSRVFLSQIEPNFFDLTTAKNQLRRLILSLLLRSRLICLYFTKTMLVALYFKSNWVMSVRGCMLACAKEFPSLFKVGYAVTAYLRFIFLPRLSKRSMYLTWLLLCLFWFF